MLVVGGGGSENVIPSGGDGNGCCSGLGGG